MSDITFFTVNAFDNGYFENGEPVKAIERLCFNTWRSKYKVKVFDYNSDEVKYCKEKYSSIYKSCLSNPKYISIFADIVRLEVLSRYRQHFYFDCDLYLIKLDLANKEKFQSNISNTFMSLYNGNDLETAKKLLKEYETGEILRDKEVIKRSGVFIQPLHFIEWLHLCGFNEKPNGLIMCYTNDIPTLKLICKNYKDFIDKYNYHKRLLIFTDRRSKEIKPFVPYVEIGGKSNLITIKSLYGISDLDRTIILNEVKSHWAYIN